MPSAPISLDEKKRAAAKLFRLLAKEQALREARGFSLVAPKVVPLLPPSPKKPTSCKPTAPTVTKAPPAKKGGKLEAELKKQEDIALPLGKIPTPPCSRAVGAIPFNYSALKTKMALSTGLGPVPGSTWLWFMIGQVEVTKSSGTDFLDVTLTAEKFQAGWTKDPTMSVLDKEIRPRQQAMLECVMMGRGCDYGSKRKGVPVGFTHRWNYSNSQWECGKESWATTGCEWWEQRKSDRWEVNVSMRWAEGGSVRPGTYVLVGEQRAEKINRNQYATAMRGALLPFSNETEKGVALTKVTATYASACKEVD